MFVRARSLGLFVVLLVLELSFLSCGRDSGDPRSAPPMGEADAGDDGASTDPAAAGKVARVPCHLRPWAPPRRVEVVSTSLEEGSPTLTADERTILFHVHRPHDGGARYELWWAHRLKRAEAFSPPERLIGPSSDADDAYPSLTLDGLTLVFASRRLDPASPYRLFRAERPDVVVSFGAAREIVSSDAAPAAWPVGSAIYPSLTPDRTTLYFAADRDGDGFYRIYRSEALDTGAFGPPVRESSVDDAASSLAFVMSADRLALFVSRADSEGRYRIHSAVRANIDEPFGPLSPVDALNGDAPDARLGWLSPDGCRAYLARRSAAADTDEDVDLYSSEREP